MTKSEKERLVGLIAEEYEKTDDYEEDYKLGLAVATKIILDFEENQ